MTETDLAQTLQPTALATQLESARKHPRLAAYRGVLTPALLDAPEREMTAMVDEAAMHDLGWLRRVAVRGEDRFRWLSGMVTNSVNDLFPNSGAWNLVLNAQGRIQGDMTVWRGSQEPTQPKHKASAAVSGGDRLLGTPFAGESGLELEIAADQYDKLMAHLNQFIIMDDVELVPMGMEPTGEAGNETAIGLTGPMADEVLERLSLPYLSQPMSGVNVEWNGFGLRIVRGYGVLAPRYELWLPVAGLQRLWSALSTAGATRVGFEAVNAYRIVEAVPLYGVDMTDRDLPQETSQMRALHFNKGCYLGQEIVERIRSRGNVHKHLRPLEVTGPLPEAGAVLKLPDGSEAGHITSAAKLSLAGGARTFALGMVRSEAEANSQSFAYAAGEMQGSATILTAPPNLRRNR